jgi:Rab-GTPase-TBC domain
MDGHIRPYFSSSPQIDVDSALFSRALENADPVVAKKVLTDMSINPVAICRPWSVFSAFCSSGLLTFHTRFTSLFVGSLPSEHLNRVWDIFLLEGKTMICISFYTTDRHCRRCTVFAPCWSSPGLGVSTSNSGRDQRSRCS